MATRRDVLFVIAAAGFALSTGRVVAAPPTVEVLAMAHSPVQGALKPVRELLAKFYGACAWSNSTSRAPKARSVRNPSG